MPSLAPSKRDFKTNTIQGDPGLLAWFWRVFVSTVGSKYVLAVSGLGLTIFVVIHMVGNIQVFAGQDAVNRYAQMLKDMGPLLWVARIGLLIVFLLHIGWAIRLVRKSRAARPVPYVHKEKVQASISSEYMIHTGLLVLAFVLFHIAHYTLGVVKGARVVDTGKTAEIGGQTYRQGTVHATDSSGTVVNYLQLRDAQGRHDVYNMVIFGFRNPIISILYLVAQGLLLMHLGHGIQSAFQSLGVNGPRWNLAIRGLGWTLALMIVGGNVAIVVGVWAGFVPLAPVYYVGM